MFEHQFVTEAAPESAADADGLDGGQGGGDGVDAPMAANGARAAERRVDAATARARAAAAAVTVAQADLVDAIRALEELDGHYLATARQWVSWQCGLTRGETRQLFALADKLPTLPLLDGAFRAGEISAGVAAVMVTVATPENERLLLDAAHDATGGQLETIVRDLRRAERDRRGRVDPEDPSIAPSQASAGWDDDGRYRGHFDLRPDEGAIAEAAFQGALADARPSEADVDNPVVEGEAKQAEKAPRATMADALLDLCRTWLAARHTDDGDRLSEAYQVIVHRTPDPLDPQGWVESICGAGVIDRDLAEMVACDATRVDQVMVAGFPVNTPTRARLFNREQRRALYARDRHCRFPGCTRSRHLHAHHADSFTDTHRTTVLRGVLLCGYHHWVVHHFKLGLHLGDDHVLVVTRPDGSTLRGAALPPPPPEAIARPPKPPPDRRRTGCGERLTRDARDSYLYTLSRATAPPPATS